MTNEEKYKTPQERDTAFEIFCNGHCCDDKCPCHHEKDVNCSFLWLSLEAEEEKIIPCPFCGGESVAYYDEDLMGHIVFCLECKTRSGLCKTKANAIAKWNGRVK